MIAPANPLRDLPGDAAYVASVIKDAGPVILVGHSYGGAVITEVGGPAPNVKALVYIDGMALDVGESALDIAERFPGSKLPPRCGRAFPADGPGHGPLHRPGELPRRLRGRPPGADDRAHGQPPSAPPRRPALEGKATTAAWKRLPTWYLVGTQDEAIPPAAQRFPAAGPDNAARPCSTPAPVKSDAGMSIADLPPSGTTVRRSECDRLERLRIESVPR